jgi:AraC-like DNA-binding protein
MDVLSQLLSSVRVTSALFFTGEFTAPWAVASARAEAIASLLGRGSGPFVACHLLTEGRAWARIEGEPSVALEPGDLVLVPRGDPHVLSSHPGDSSVAERPVDEALPAMSAADGPSVARSGGGGALARFVSGYLACDQDGHQLLRSGLPSLIRLELRTDAAGRWLEGSIHYLASDFCWHGRARSVLVTRMADTLLVEALRRHASQLPEESSWLGGAGDPAVGAALALFHHKPWHRWTVAELAAEVAVSRSVLAERFTRCMGEPPLRYLGRLRLRLAARILKTTRTSILQLASDVGYTSEAAFNRAFKREFGLPPARYRKASIMRRHQGPTSIREDALIAPTALRRTRKLQ